MEAHEYVHRIDRTGGKIQKAAMTLLCDTTLKSDFSIPIAARASRMFGSISEHLVAQVIPMIRNAAQASRAGLAVGILQVLCNGMCTAKRFHVDSEEQSCRVGCIDESDCLSHCNRCPLLCDIFCHNPEKRRGATSRRPFSSCMT